MTVETEGPQNPVAPDPPLASEAKAPPARPAASGSIIEENRTARRAPTAMGYVGLNVAVWAYLAVQAWILIRATGTTRVIIFFSVVLALGFAAASIFDYVWLRLRR